MAYIPKTTSSAPLVISGVNVELDGLSSMGTVGQSIRVASDGSLEWYTPEVTTVSGVDRKSVV